MMLVEMLVEGVFLVSGVVKTVFSPIKKTRDFFCFSPRTKGSKAGLRGNFQITTFPYGNAENVCVLLLQDLLQSCALGPLRNPVL
jgi:hypothetical protein